MNDKQSTLTGTLQEQAGYWIVRQHSGAWSAQDSLTLKEWLAESHEHRLAFEQVQSLWQGLDQFKNIASDPLKQRHRKHRFKPQYWPLAGATAAIMAFVMFFVGVDMTCLLPSEQIYATAKGQLINVTLADGSELVLNTDTELKVQLNPLKRLITLNHGEASFKVAHEAWRGFSVRAGNGEIIDIGTCFNVNKSLEKVIVTVTEGAVKVQTNAQSSPSLVAGQRLSYNPEGILTGPDRPDLTIITAWQHEQLIFDMTPLSEVTAQLSRYHPVKFVFDDPKLKDLKTSGTFNTQNLQAFLSALESIYPLRAKLGNDQTVHLKMTTQH